LPIKFPGKNSLTNRSDPGLNLKGSKLVKTLSIKKLFVILFGISFFLGALLFVLENQKKQNGGGTILTVPSPTPTPPEERIISPSAYATDPEILEIEKNLSALEKKLVEIDFYEAKLTPPSLDMKVNFRK
jgi:hypothetical protein